MDRSAAVLLLLVAPACGAGTITSEDVTPGQAIAIAVVVVVALLYVVYTGGRGR